MCFHSSIMFMELFHPSWLSLCHCPWLCWVCVCVNNNDNNTICLYINGWWWLFTWTTTQMNLSECWNTWQRLRQEWWFEKAKQSYETRVIVWELVCVCVCVERIFTTFPRCVHTVIFDEYKHFDVVWNPECDYVWNNTDIFIHTLISFHNTS